MTVKLVKRGLIVLQDYSAPMLMRARIKQVMRNQFTVFQADDELRTVLASYVPGDVALIPVVDKAGALVGIVEPHDLLRTDSAERPLKMRELVRQDFVLAQPDDLVDEVHREMLRKSTENVVVVRENGLRVPIGIARANDILQLRRWLMEEETLEKKQPAARSR
jgi:CBS domain-containing protein